MPNEANIELRSEAVQEIIGTPPKKIIRIGISIIFSIVLLIIIGSFFFKYPDTIQARLTLTGQNPPADIKARVNGKITELFVNDKQTIEAETLLAELENMANYGDILKLESALKSVDLNKLEQLKLPENIVLGELQTPYAGLERLLQEYHDFKEMNYFPKKKEASEKQLVVYKKSLSLYQKQLKILQSDYQLNKKQFERDSTLFSQNVIAEAEFEKSKSSFLNKKMSIESARNSITNIELQIVNTEQQMLDYGLQHIDNKRKLENAIEEQVENLKAQIALWKQNYLLISPINGTVSFNAVWSSTQNVTTGQTVFTIVPNSRTELKGRMQIPLNGAGKVKIGQQVNIKFDDFPETEFGMVRGIVSDISLVQQEESYTVSVQFTDSLTTSYNKQLPFISNMQGNAEIITEDLPLITRLFNPLKDIFLNK